MHMFIICCLAAHNIDGTVLRVSDDLVIFGVTFNSKIAFEKHRLVSRAVFKDLVS